MYDTRLANRILQVLNLRFPLAMNFKELKEASGEPALPEDELLSATEALRRDGLLEGDPIRGDHRDLPYDFYNLRITKVARERLASSRRESELTVRPRPAAQPKQVPNVPTTLFLSHAAGDADIAVLIKSLLESAFPKIHVFVTSDPVDLAPGDEWVKAVKENLSKANVSLILATNRGLDRKWVWFETGAAWALNTRIIPLCLGKTQKGGLPHPFAGYQSIQLETDLRNLVNSLKNEFGPIATAPDYPQTISKIVQLDGRAEEFAEPTPATAPDQSERAQYLNERKRKVEDGLEQLSGAEKEAIRQLLIEGQLTDQRAIELLRQKGLVERSLGGIFQRIASTTGFVERVWSYQGRDTLMPYEGPWRINPSFKALLEKAFAGSNG